MSNICKELTDVATEVVSDKVIDPDLVPEWKLHVNDVCGLSQLLGSTLQLSCLLLNLQFYVR